MHGFAVLAVVSTSGLHLHQHGGATRTCGLGASAARRSRLWPRMVAGGDSYDTNEVVLAARKGKTEALSALLAADRAAANTAVACAKIPTMDGATPIIWAARQGKLEAVQLLLSNAADVNAAAQSGWTALYAAALNGHETIVELLVSNDASGEPTLILTPTLIPTLTTEPDANPDPNPNPNPDPDLDVSRGRHGRG